MKWMTNLSFGAPKSVLGTISTSVNKVEEASNTALKLMEERNRKYSERVAKKTKKDAE